MTTLDRFRQLVASTKACLEEAHVPHAIITAGLVFEREWIDFLLARWAEQGYRDPVVGRFEMPDGTVVTMKPGADCTPEGARCWGNPKGHT
jgi:hypothetical protein